MNEDRDRRLEIVACRQREQGVGIRWSLDQHDIRIEPLQRVYQAARRSRSVMTDAEQVQVGRKVCGHTSSRQARYRSFQPSRSFTTVSRYSRQTTLSCTGSLTTAPTR